MLLLLLLRALPDAPRLLVVPLLLLSLELSESRSTWLSSSSTACAYCDRCCRARQQFMLCVAVSLPPPRPGATAAAATVLQGYSSASTSNKALPKPLPVPPAREDSSRKSGTPASFSASCLIPAVMADSSKQTQSSASFQHCQQGCSLLNTTCQLKDTEASFVSTMPARMQLDMFSPYESAGGFCCWCDSHGAAAAGCLVNGLVLFEGCGWHELEGIC